jgi:hypothetical protein
MPDELGGRRRDILWGFRRHRAREQGRSLPPPAPQASLPLFRPYKWSVTLRSILLYRFMSPLRLRSGAHRHNGEEAVQVEIESGTQAASRGPTWRIATPLV